MNYQKKLVLLITISTMVRLIIASSVELSSAEVYYWAFSQKLEWNYFDHPPMVAWLIRLTTANLILHTELFVRLGAIIASAISTWLIFRIGTVINNVQTGWFSALLYTTSLYGSLIAGTFIIPDSPQMIFWLYSILILIKITHSNAINLKSTLLWCLFGIAAGLCIMSKVHGVFLWFGVALYALLVNRGWLKHPGIYIAAIITLIIISPIIIWNVQNDFITYKFHSSRVALTGAGLHLKVFFKEFLSEVLITNPVNFFLICSSLVWASKGKLRFDKKDSPILLFCSLPLIIVLLFISLFRETLAHWPGPAYSTLLILPAIKLSSNIERKRRNIPNIIKAAFVLLILPAVSTILITNFYPGTISVEKQGLKMGAEDLTLDMYGWEEAGKNFDSLYKSDMTKKIMPCGAPIIVTNWFPAAHIDFYIANKTKQQTIGIGGVLSLHQYYWMNKYKKGLKSGDSAYYIVPSNLFDYKTFEQVTNSFTNFDMALTINQYRSGVICKQVYVFRMKGYRR